MTIIPLILENEITARTCQTCRGAYIVYSYRIDSGPYEVPPGGKKSKWLDGLETGDGWYIGEMQAEPCPDCAKNRLRNHLRSKSGMEGEDFTIRLSQFRIDGVNKAKQHAKDIMASLAGMQKNASGLITLWGEYGVGKTMLLKGLVNELIESGCEAMYITAPDMIAEIRDGFNAQANRSLAIENAIAKYQTVKCLCLDEFDKVSLTDWVKETVFRLLNYRYDHRKDLATVIGSNKEPEKYDEEMGYFKNRMQGGIIIQVPGPSIRLSEGIVARKEFTK